AAPGTGAQIRDHGHVVALDQAAMAAAVTGGRPHRRKERIPPGQQALQAAEQLRHNTTTTEDTSVHTGPSVIDMSVYERAAQNRTQLP
ncbi:IS21 family transposase, partial [Gordonia paraffinivorans]